jgi:hypothetical protein
MLNKSYGAKSIGNLRNDGCSNREIEDIVEIADKHRALPSKVRELFSSGYNVNQVSEIYDAARTAMTSVKTMDSFYEAFKPEKDCLVDMANDVYGLSGAGISGDSKSDKMAVAHLFKEMINIRNETGGDFYECIGMLEDNLFKEKEDMAERGSYEFNYDTGEVLV